MSLSDHLHQFLLLLDFEQVVLSVIGFYETKPIRSLNRNRFPLILSRKDKPRRNRVI